MFKCNLEKVARDIAREKKLFYGWSIFGSGWLVGTKEQLKAIGVLEPRDS